LYHADGSSVGYDSLDQLSEFQRGTLSDTNSDNIPDTVTNPTREQGWTLDAQGNWSSLATDGTPESRTHNKQNQVTQVGLNNLSFDANGNLTTDQAGQQYVFDAWNRMVAVKNSGGTTIAAYEFDALGRRIEETVSGTTRDVYFSSAWQVLEERVGSDVKTQYIWSPVYVDALILHDRDADANQGNGLEERLYVQQDANFNVTAVINTGGAVQERYAYDPYGSVSYLAPDWTSRSSSIFAWKYGHQGLAHEPVTTLIVDRNRDIHPALGRFLLTDPILFTAGDWNLYRMVGNNPTTSLDPSGLIRTVLVGHVLGTVANSVIAQPPGYPTNPTPGIDLPITRPLNIFSQITGSEQINLGLASLPDGGYYYIRPDGAICAFYGCFQVSVNGTVVRPPGTVTFENDNAWNVAMAMSGGYDALRGWGVFRAWWIATRPLANANFAQRYFSEVFSGTGTFSGMTINQVATGLRRGTIAVRDVPIQYIIRDGNVLILNTRSAEALRRAGIARSQWRAVNMTGNPTAEARLTGQLRRNELGSRGCAAPTSSGGGTTP
jgi:RHS repeat-associated protein